ncbi:ankyrin repeat and fibronectin type III domain containing protein wide awake isoform 2-T7 [Cochliomyia hominivorax]
MEDVVTATPPPPPSTPTTTTTAAASSASTTNQATSHSSTPAQTAPAPAPPPTKKSSTTLSVDRAAFLLLRVKKAFKRKRQHRKEKQAQALNASINNQAGRTNRGKVPPPLLRSRTLPAIIVPGIPVVSLHTDKSPFQWATSSATKSSTSSGSGNRWSILTRNTTTTTPTTHQQSNVWNNNNNNNFNNNNNTLSIKSLNLPKDDGTLVFRRKSSGSTPGNTTTQGQQTGGGGGSGTPDASITSYAATMNVCGDDFECYAADGSVLLRIPAPHVVAARAYRLASKKRTSSIFSSGGVSAGSGGSSTSTSDNNTRCSGDNTPTLEGGCQIPGFSVCSSGSNTGCGSGGGGGTDANNPNSHLTSGFSTSSTTTSSSSSSTNTSTNTALTRRLAKLLHQSSTSVLSKSQHHHHHHHHHHQQQQQQQQHTQQYDVNMFNTTTTTSALTAPQPCGEDAPRRLSWERRKDSSALQRSASIDSFAEIVWSDSPRPSLDIPRPAVAPFSKRPSASSLFSNCSTSSQSAQLNINEWCTSSGGVGGGGGSGTVGIGGLTTGVGGTQSTCGMITTTGNSRRESLLSPSSTRRNKLTRIINALFSAVEHGHLDKARTILESTDVDVNSINTDGLSALDVAVLSNNRSMTKMLLQHGALEGSQFSVDSIGTKLNGLLKDAEVRINDLSGLEGTCQPSFSSRPSISSIIIGNTGSSVTGCTGNEVDKQIGIWERRVKGLRRLLLGWDQARPPDAPSSVIVDVTGDNSIQVQILEPFEGAIGTKFKVQWSTRADFSNIVGERELMDWRSFHGTMGTQCHITNLTQGRRYFLRAACGNVKGWGPYKTSVPASVVPSSWRDLNNREDRYLGRQRMLDNLFTAVRLARPSDVSELTLDTNSQQRRNPKKKTTIKQLFSVASKFQKHLRRGIYLASIVYCEDKVLVTSEDFLPVIEIDESYPSSLNSDYHWLMKVACTWDDVKSLRTDMERNLTSANHFRTKLLSAVCQMQSALGFNDLGQLYYKPLRDAHGTVVLTCIQSVKSQKVVSILNSRWLPVNKLQKKIGALHEEYNINEVLISSITDQIQYHQTALQRLSPGLYLGYLKMQCSMDQIQVVVPAKTPNVLPHYKVRDNSHITAEEWQVLKKDSDEKSGDGRRCASPLRLTLNFNTNTEATTEVQRLFLYDLTTATQKLFKYMNIKPEEANTHRLYDVEVIEHSKEISFLIICPSVELSCAVPGQSELLLQREDLASLSIQAFEMIHLSTYQPGIIQKYARLSCILELDTALANHSQREAFSTSELQTAKERLAKLQELTASLNAVWKAVRWLMDVIAFARDKNAPPSAAMKEILDFGQQVDENNQLLQPPIRDMKFTKSGSGRGSWPGPGASSSGNINMGPEHSKSEQNLGLKASTPTSGTRNQKQQNQMQSSQTNVTTPATPNFLQVNNEFMTSDMSLRKNSGDSGTSQYTTQSFNSTNDSVLTSNSDFAQLFNVPPSRSDDTLSEAAKQQNQKSQILQRKRTSSNITPTSTPVTPLITVHSSSVPYLGRDPSGAGSCQSLKVNYNGEYESKQIKTAEKVKSASSANLRDNGLYLKTTLTTLKAEVKKANSSSLDENLAPSVSTSSTKNLQRQSSQEEYTATSCPSLATDATEPNNTPSGIIQVYTAYNTGLASGTSLKLHVTAKTTAREVVNLVVKQLNMAAVLKGSNGPIYSAEMLDNFCLVAVIGARERCLRDDFKPLLLQNPWKKGRLYVRQKHELLAAIEHSNRKSHLI